MVAIRVLIILILTGLVSCSSPSANKHTVAVTGTIVQTAAVGARDTLPFIPDTTKWPAEGKPNFIVDDYPLTDQMLDAEAYKRISGEIYDGEGAWFSNEVLKQSLVFVLYTDHHRMVTYHFLNDDIPAGIIKRMELHVDDGDTASFPLKQKYFKGFIAQAKRTGSSYFISNKGFKPGDDKKKAIKVYGKPDKREMANGIETLEWEFVGDYFYSETMDLKGKPLAKDNFGHQVIMFFRNSRLTGLILHNDIP